MKKFMFLTYGFIMPTTEIIKAWDKWIELIKDNLVEKGHFPRGKEISHQGSKDLPMDIEAITGYCIIEAETFEEAEKLANENPFITSIRIYEIMEK